MTLLASATTDTLGLVGTFVIAIGAIVNVLVVYIAALVIAEKRENDEYKASRPNTSQ